MFDQHPDGDLVRQPDVGAGQPALGDLPAQHLHVVGDPRRQPVTELRIGVEPLKLMMRAGDLEGGPGDLRNARQRGLVARVKQPWPAPHQRDQEQLRRRIQVKRQQRAFAIRRCRAGVRRGIGLPPVPPRHGHRELEAVVEHRTRADGRGSRVHQPAASRFAFTFDPGQPDPVPVPRHVQRVRPADVGDPGAFRGRRDDPGTAGQTPAGGDRQVHLRPPSEHQLAAIGDPADLARRRSDVCCHRLSVGSAFPRRHP